MKPEDIKIDPEFEALLDPLDDDEKRKLTASIKGRGILHPLIVWKGEGILLDGHNRLRIAKEIGAEFEVKELEFGWRRDAYRWIIVNQLARRNLDKDRIEYYRGQLYTQIKKNSADNLVQNKPKGQNVPSVNSAKAVAEKTGVSEKTVKRNAKTAKRADEIRKEKPDTSIRDAMKQAKAEAKAAPRKSRRQTKRNQNAPSDTAMFVWRQVKKNLDAIPDNDVSLPEALGIMRSYCRERLGAGEDTTATDDESLRKLLQSFLDDLPASELRRIRIVLMQQLWKDTPEDYREQFLRWVEQRMKAGQ